MTTAVEYALMAGASYISNRALANRFPVPQGWFEITELRRNNPNSGFEATTFTNGTEIVISYAGTDFSSLSSDFLYGNIPLALGNLSDQLRQAADYYLQVKAVNPNATITFTGHSLGGGLASLMAVLFDENAYTFDQAPFRNSALFYTTTDEMGNTITRSAAQDLRTYLTGRAPESMLAKLDAYIAAGDPSNLNPVAADTLAGREGRVTNLNVQGEILSNFPVNVFDRIGIQADANNLGNSTTGVSGGDLHSQALLIAFLQSGDTPTSTASDRTLGQVSFKLTDLLKVIFDDKLFFNNPLNITADAKENFLERLVKHEATVIDTATGETDAMVKRFTSDLWKLAQDGGLTMRDGNLTNADLNEVSKTLIAFAMQKYYEETSASVGYREELFTDLATAGGGSGGIRFDMAAVSTTFAAAFAEGKELILSDAKGFEQYFKYYLQQSTFTEEERNAITFLLPNLRDWHVQAAGAAANDESIHTQRAAA